MTFTETVDHMSKGYLEGKGMHFQRNHDGNIFFPGIGPTVCAVLVRDSDGKEQPMEISFRSVPGDVPSVLSLREAFSAALNTAIVKLEQSSAPEDHRESHS